MVEVHYLRRELYPAVGAGFVLGIQQDATDAPAPLLLIGNCFLAFLLDAIRALVVFAVVSGPRRLLLRTQFRIGFGHAEI
jgi:hypothetical protein